jgi:hypothetical protein
MIENLAALSLLKKRELGEIRSLGEQKMTLRFSSLPWDFIFSVCVLRMMMKLPNYPRFYVGEVSKRALFCATL